MPILQGSKVNFRSTYKVRKTTFRNYDKLTEKSKTFKSLFAIIKWECYNKQTCRVEIDSAVILVLNNCVVCRKCNARSEQQYMSNLPAARLQIHEPPFSHVGTNYFGPLVVKVKRSQCKRYGCLFTCMTTRAIHLELSYDSTSSAIINALRRFLARRGPVKCIYSDNGTNFVGAERILSDSFLNNKSSDVSNYLRQQGTSWSFNPLNASHIMIRTVRKVLLAVTPKATLTDDDLYTLLTEVESIKNSRPLADITLEAGAVTYPLTPNHLLRLNPAMAPLPVATD